MREATYPPHPLRRRLTPTSSSLNLEGPPLTPLERRRAPPRCCITDVDLPGGVWGGRGGRRKVDEELETYKTNSLLRKTIPGQTVDSGGSPFSFHTSYRSGEILSAELAANQPPIRLKCTFTCEPLTPRVDGATFQQTDPTPKKGHPLTHFSCKYEKASAGSVQVNPFSTS